MKLTSKEKQAELQRYRVLLLATIDYLCERNCRSWVTDGKSWIQVYYEQQKLQTERNFIKRRLDRLKQQLDRLTRNLWIMGDLQFERHIKETTGEDLNLFEDMNGRINAILAQGKIQTREEIDIVILQLHIYKQTAADTQKEGDLKELLQHYKRGDEFASTTGKKKADYTEITKREEKDGLVIEDVRIVSGPKPAHFIEVEAISPDGKRKVRVTQWGTKKSASTSVSIQFPTASGGIYGVSGLYPISAYWKDNNTVVIEVPKEIVANDQCQTVESFDDKVSIEYITQ